LEQPLYIVPAEQKSDAFAESHCVSCWFIINTCEEETAAYRAGFFKALLNLELRIVLSDSALPASITRPVCRNPLYLRNTITTTTMAIIAKIKTKAWYEVMLAEGFIDRSVNPNAKEIDEAYVSTYIIEWIEFAEDAQNCSDLLLQNFQDEFNKWIEQTFGIASDPPRRMLKDFLRFNGVYISKNEKTPGKETKLSISAQLARLLKEDESSLWPEKNLQEESAKTGFRSSQLLRLIAANRHQTI
jgi:hypothetical protein